MLIWLNLYNAVGVNIATQTEKKKTKFVAKDTANGLTRAATELKVVKIIITTKRKRGLKMPEYIEREAVEKAVLIKQEQERQHWLEYLKQFRTTKEYSTKEQAVDNWLRGYGEAVGNLLAIFEEGSAVEVVRCKECCFAVPLDKHCEINSSAYRHCLLLRGDETKNVWHKYTKYYKDYSIVELDGFCSEAKPYEQALGKKEGAEE